MKHAKLLHNPGAGSGEYSIESIAKMIEAAGFGCSYSSTKLMTEPTINSDDYDFVVLAGGDGTVRKIAQTLLDHNLPIGLLPMGTANNIARTLGIHGNVENIIASWKNENLKAFDVGMIDGFSKPSFFLEGVGFGVFPALMEEMKKTDKNSIEDPGRKIRSALELTHDIVCQYPPNECRIIVDGKEHSGNYILVEVMNTRSIGPNLELAPHADPGDGSLDLVMITENDRSMLTDYLAGKLNDQEKPELFHTIKCTAVELLWKGDIMHIDDNIKSLNAPVPLKIQLAKGVLQFYIPGRDQVFESMQIAI